MRRKDHEITDPAKIEELMENCDRCRMAFCDQGVPYMVPLNYGYGKTEDTYVLYFHGARAGRKFNLLKENPEVCVEMDLYEKMSTEGKTCSHSPHAQSIILNGKAEIVDDEEEKKKALLLILKHDTGRSDWELDPRMFRATCVFKVKAETLSAKEIK